VKDATKVDTPTDKEVTPKEKCEESPKELAAASSDIDDERRKKDPDESGESGSSNSRRIRNKDRPTIPLYRPGMLSKRKTEDDVQKGEAKPDSK